jgi:hypothetical protein
MTAMRGALLLTVLFAAGCAHLAPAVAPPTESAVVSDRLFCGLSIPGGGTIAESDLAAFITEVVTPRFPEGFTVWRAKGQWRGGDEQTLVIELIHPFDARIDAAVREIAEEYRRRFHQEAVMRVTMSARIDFVK